jgi:HptB-dependent secretion and biofilm anti anti-sigma factor
MQLLRTKQGSTEVLKLRGRFDWHRINDFAVEAAKNVNAPGIQGITIDLGEVDYIDSSAIGALLVLRDKMRLSNQALTLAGATGSVLETLKNMSIDKLIAMK